MSIKAINEYSVTVIIPTAGIAERYDSLLRAIMSVKAQNYSNLSISIIFNGQNVYKELYESVKDICGVVVYNIEKGHLPDALLFGRQSVKTDFYCFLDDDDYLLPNHIHEAIRILTCNDSVDVVVSNGWNSSNGQEVARYCNFLDNALSPAKKVLQNGNWLASCGGVFRTSTVSEKFFANNQKYYEWTLTALLLGLSKRVEFVDQKSYVISQDGASLSRSVDSLLAEPIFLRRLKMYSWDKESLKLIDSKEAAAHFEICKYYLNTKDKKSALVHYIRCLKMKSWYKYVLFIRKFVTT